MSQSLLDYSMTGSVSQHGKVPPVNESQSLHNHLFCLRLMPLIVIRHSVQSGMLALFNVWLADLILNENFIYASTTEHTVHMYLEIKH